MEEMTIEQIEAELARLAGERAKIKQEMLAVHKILDQRMAEESVKAKLAGMGDAEKQALAQALQAEGIGSEEEFGEL